MPSLAIASPVPATSTVSRPSADGPFRKSHEKTLSSAFAFTDGAMLDSRSSGSTEDFFRTTKNGSLHSLPNGLPNGIGKGATDLVNSKSEETTSSTLDNESESNALKGARTSKEGSTTRASQDPDKTAQANGVAKGSQPLPEEEKLKMNGEKPTTAGSQVSALPSAMKTAESPTSHKSDASTLSPNKHHAPPLQRFSSPP